MSVAVALLITIGEIDHLLSQVLDDGRTWSVTKLTGVTAALHPGDTLDGWEFFADRAQGANGQVDGWLRMYAVADVALVATYALLGVAWFRRFRSTRLGRNGTLLVLVGAGADLVENVLIGLGAPLGWLLLVATAVKWLTLLPAAPARALDAEADASPGCRRRSTRTATRRSSCCRWRCSASPAGRTCSSRSPTSSAPGRTPGSTGTSSGPASPWACWSSPPCSSGASGPGTSGCAPVLAGRVTSTRAPTASAPSSAGASTTRPRSRCSACGSSARCCSSWPRPGSGWPAPTSG